MATAFQSNAFQNNAFQIVVSTAAAPVGFAPHRARRRRIAKDDEEVMKIIKQALPYLMARGRNK